MTTSTIPAHIVDRAIGAIDEQYAAWERGDACSPSTLDLVITVHDNVLGLVEDGTPLDRFDAIADEVYERQCDGADIPEVARLILDRLATR